MSAETELEEVPLITDFAVWVQIKRSSKYYHQGLVDCTNQKSKPRFFKLENFVPGIGTALSLDGYFLTFNNNRYRIEDCYIFLGDPKEPKNLLRLR